MFNFGWFSSGRDQAAIELFEAACERLDRGFIPGRLAFVFCDRASGETPASDRFLAAVQARDLPLVTHSSLALRRLIRQHPPDLAAFRSAFDAQVIEKLRDFDVEVAVLAGYMLIISPLLSRAFLCLNLHPAVPGGPKGTWQEVMWQLIQGEARETGAMMHLATPELDAGPPVAYFRFPIRGPKFDPLWDRLAGKLHTTTLAAIRKQEGENEPLFAQIRREELRREFPLILLTLKSLAEEQLKLTRAGAVAQGRLIPGGFDLTPQVEEFLQRVVGGGG